jgi:hypothetical protein
VTPAACAIAAVGTPLSLRDLASTVNSWLASAIALSCLVLALYRLESSESARILGFKSGGTPGEMVLRRGADLVGVAVVSEDGGAGGKALLCSVVGAFLTQKCIVDLGLTGSTEFASVDRDQPISQSAFSLVFCCSGERARRNRISSSGRGACLFTYL